MQVWRTGIPHGDAVRTRIPQVEVGCRSCSIEHHGFDAFATTQRSEFLVRKYL